MQGSKKIIKFSAICTALSGIITYFITVNMEISWISVNSIWISNSFLLTIMGGVLASFLVTLSIECKNYIDKKREVETEIFFQTFYLYQQLFVMQKLISDFLEHSNEAVPQGLLNANAYKAECQRNAIGNIQYAPFSARNTITIAHSAFCKDVLIKVDHILAHRFYLDIAINTAQIESMKCMGTKITVTSETEPVHKVLLLLQQDMETVMGNVDSYLSTVNKYWKNRYKWDELKVVMNSSYISMFGLDSFEEFVQQKGKKTTK